METKEKEREITDFIDKFKKAWELAGVYASAFLLSLPNILFFLFFILQVQRRETNFLCMYENEKQ